MILNMIIQLYKNKGVLVDSRDIWVEFYIIYRVLAIVVKEKRKKTDNVLSNIFFPFYLR